MAWLRQSPKANALGVPDGPPSGIARLDVDQRGDDLERAVIQRAGDTPFKVRTASEKMHLLYRYVGERRLTARRRPGRKDPSNLQPWDDLCVDLCGTGGYSVSPPGQCAGGEYRFLGDVTLEQLLERRHELPIIQGLPDRACKPIECRRRR
jgi:hypothetical protein